MNILKLAVFGIILILSFFLISSQDIKVLSDQSLFFKLFTAFIAGFLYTSFLTSPLAVVLFVILSGTTNLYLITIIAGMGAVLGDLFIVKILRMIFKAFSFISHVGRFIKIKVKLKKNGLDLVSLVLGCLIIASPFPDELGLVLLGASKLSYFKIALLIFVANSVGIYVILNTALLIK